MGRIRNWIGASCLCVLACGGISERGSTDETGGTASGGSSAGSVTHPSLGGSAMTHAGTNATGGSAPSSGGVTAGGAPVAAGGTPVAVAGAPTTGGTSTTGHVEPGSACYNDSDCPEPACGGEVCNWTKTAPNPVGMRVFYCNPAGTQASHMDGWCTTDADCKCRGQGARCVAPYCSFTRPQDAPGR